MTAICLYDIITLTKKGVKDYMENIILTKKDIKKLEPLSSDNSGLWGTCYKYEDGVLKVFQNIFFDKEMKKRIKKNLERDSEIIMYPKKKLYVIDRGPFLSGYKCPLAKGYSLDDLAGKIIDEKIDISFNDFKSAYYDKFLNLLKKETVIISDVKQRHIFYDDGFTLIDTDFYEEPPKEISDNEKNKINIGLFNNELAYFFSLIVGVYGHLWNKENEDFIEKYLDLILKETKNEVDSLKKLRDYSFTDLQKNKLRGLKI